jgi:hypothetical protein
MIKSGFLFPMLKGTELIAGAVFLSNRLVPLAVAMAAPVIVTLLAFPAPGGLPLALILLALEVFLAWTYRQVFCPLSQQQGARASERGLSQPSGSWR